MCFSGFTQILLGPDINFIPRSQNDPDYKSPAKGPKNDFTINNSARIMTLRLSPYNGRTIQKFFISSMT